ncbi:MAG TPA: hypothetical protein VH561_18155 [Micromonosporaceae bacterium]
MNEIAIIDDAWEKCGTRDVEQDAERAEQERNQAQSPDIDDMKPDRQRHREQEHATAEIGCDHDRLSTHAIDPCARGQPKDQPRDGTHRGKERHLEGVGLEHEDRRERKRQCGHGVAYLADRLTEPEAAEVCVSPRAHAGSPLNDVTVRNAERGRSRRRRRSLAIMDSVRCPPVLPRARRSIALLVLSRTRRPSISRLVAWFPCPQHPADDRHVGVTLTEQPTARARHEIAGLKDDELDAVAWHLLIAAHVVQRTLNATVHATDGQDVGLVEVRHRPVMLEFAVLDHNATVRPVAVDRQSRATARLARVAAQPIETMLPAASVSQDLIA